MFFVPYGVDGAVSRGSGTQKLVVTNVNAGVAAIDHLLDCLSHILGFATAVTITEGDSETWHTDFLAWFVVQSNPKDQRPVPGEI
jgi:hypothetical protein